MKGNKKILDTLFLKKRKERRKEGTKAGRQEGRKTGRQATCQPDVVH